MCKPAMSDAGEKVRAAPPTTWTKLCRTTVPPAWHAVAQRHMVYRASPLCYVACGLALGWAEAGRPGAIPYEPALWLVQALLCYRSDVSTLGRDSAWHAADRVYAWSFTVVRLAFCILVQWWAWGFYSRAQFQVLSVGLVVGFGCRILSKVAWTGRKCDLYLAAHAGWHIAPPLAMVAVAYMHVPL